LQTAPQSIGKWMRFRCGDERTDALHLSGLLRSHQSRPSHRSAAKQPD
jgi:hypothetical protein